MTHLPQASNLSFFIFLSISSQCMNGPYSGWAFTGLLTDSGGKGLPLPKICHTDPTMVKLGTVIPYLKKIQKIYESRDTPLEFC